MPKMFNRLSAAEVERLALIAEECAEVIHVVAKVLRHGYESHHPRGTLSNRQLLEREIGDVRFAEMLMARCGDVDSERILVEMVGKGDSVDEYLHHQLPKRLAEVRKLAAAALAAERRR